MKKHSPFPGPPAHLRMLERKARFKHKKNLPSGFYLPVISQGMNLSLGSETYLRMSNVLGSLL